MAFDIDIQDLEHNIPQSAWEMKRDMTTPEIQQIHYVCYMQKQQKKARYEFT